MQIILILLIIVFIAIFPRLRCLISHPIKTIHYAIVDLYKYIRYRRWNEYKNYGTLTVFTGLFGKGKTLTMTKVVREIYKRYNGKKVFDFKDRHWKTQYIRVVSNVKFTDIPYIELTNLSDMLTLSNDKYVDGVSTTIFVIDEASTQLNSREYKENFSTALLNVLLTCRHYRFQLFLSSQRFLMVDKLVRGVTLFTQEASKLWRTCLITTYDAWTVENVADVTKVKPIKQECYFITDEDFRAYDTMAVVENFKDNVKNGNVLFDSEIMEFYDACNNYTDLSLKRRWRIRHHL